jgi:ribosome biogenesis GTPase / thiamine phosphate phosphatase
MPTFSLDQLGWSASYSRQLSIEEFTEGFPARVTSAQRSGLTVLSEYRDTFDVVVPALVLEDTGSITVGDWVLIEQAAPRVMRLIPRRSLLARMSAGTEQRVQPIAANLDSLFIVTSCNGDFNLSRLERYLALALESHVEPVIVLTKADLCTDGGTMFLERARNVAGRARVLAVNATAPDAADSLAEWLMRGRTIAFVGSSGVGKSTLINTLMGTVQQATGGIREHDARGRHTTTSRQMLALPCGAWVIDTPGMRELKLGAVEAGVRTAFADLEALAQQCRFRNCNHHGDVDCALQAAIGAGTLDARRLTNYLKLQREAERAVRSERERREMERKFGRMAREAVRRKERQRKD